MSPTYPVLQGNHHSDYAFTTNAPCPNVQVSFVSSHQYHHRNNVTYHGNDFPDCIADDVNSCLYTKKD